MGRDPTNVHGRDISGGGRALPPTPSGWSRVGLVDRSGLIVRTLLGRWDRMALVEKP